MERDGLVRLHKGACCGRQHHADAGASTLLTNPVQNPKLCCRPGTDLVPVAALARMPFVQAVADQPGVPSCRGELG